MLGLPSEKMGVSHQPFCSVNPKTCTAVLAGRKECRSPSKGEQANSEKINEKVQMYAMQ